jgi:hypothetical protein
MIEHLVHLALHGWRKRDGPTGLALIHSDSSLRYCAKKMDVTFASKTFARSWHCLRTIRLKSNGRAKGSSPLRYLTQVID